MIDEMETHNNNWVLDLSKASDKDVKHLVDGADESILVETLKDVETNIKSTPNNQLLSHNFLYAIVCMLERYKVDGEAQLLFSSEKILEIVCTDYRLERCKLVEMGIMGILSDIMTMQAENQMSSQALGETEASTTLLHIIAGFLPVVNSIYHHDLTGNSNELLRRGPNASDTIRQENEDLLKIVVPKLFKICQQTPHCPISYKILLLKTIYWAEDILSDLVRIEDLIRYTKNLIDTNPNREDNIIIGFAIMCDISQYIYKFRQLFAETMNDFLKARKATFSSWLRSSRFNLVLHIYHRMPTYWLEQDTISKYQIEEQNLNLRIETINFTLNCIMPDIDDDDDGKPSQRSLYSNYNNLRKLVKYTLNLPNMLRHKGKLTASPEGIRKFHDLVTFIVKTIDALIIRDDFLCVTSDLYDIEDPPVPECPSDIKLGLGTSASFDRVLGSSQLPEQLRTDPLVRALRLLSILYEVNENWGILLGSLSAERLIDRNCFISEVLKNVMHRIKVKEINPYAFIPSYMLIFGEKYPFMMLLEHRETFCRSIISQSIDRIQAKKKLFIIERKNVLNVMAGILHHEVEKEDIKWNFKFIGENGLGAGATKEFYTEFSHDCQRFSHGLWSGEAGEVIDGVSYVKSQSGLFPHPKSLVNPMAKPYLNAIGIVMAKALVEKHMLDINFSHAFYKCLFKKNLYAQQLSLVDIKDVMPSTFKFVESLVDALRERFYTRMDNSLTIEEQNQTISNITCDGCSFEDLCVNFTLPSFPDIEMVEGGSEIFLSIENIENYLKLLIWWLLYETPQKCIKEVRSGFEKTFDPSLRQFFYPHEYEELFCGLTKELWTVDILKQNCVLEGLSIESPVIQYLFEVLSSLSAYDQRHFLQFVTATPRLPVGGLDALRPKLKMRLKGAHGNPDNYLPTSFTCSNTLFITTYSCKEVLEEKLLLAIREGRNFFNFS